MKKKYHYFYKITNLINGQFYYGIHSTNDLNDGYFGSGRRLKCAINTYGKENFKKDILRFFDSRKDCSDYEAKMVTEQLVKDPDCYNIKCGGDYGTAIGTIIVVDKNDVWQRCCIDDPRIKTGELKHFGKGKVSVYDSIQNRQCFITIEEYKDNKERYIHRAVGKVVVKDNTGKYEMVDLTDERYINGELKPIWSNRKHKPETIEKQKETFKRIGHQQGSKNSHYGCCWVYNPKTNKNLSIKKSELDTYLSQGFVKGRLVDDKYRESKYDKILDYDKIVSLRKQKYSFTAINEMLGVPREAVRRYCKRHNIE